MLHKSHPIASFKALKDDNGDLTGEFEAIVSVFGNVDLVGDRVVKGAFTKSLDRWKASGDPIPVIWSHQWQDPFAHIGAVTEASETAKGLRVKGSLDMGNPTAAYLAKLLAERRVKEFSFAYDVVDERRAKDGANELVELDIIEVGPTLKGANPETQLIGAKARDRKAYAPLAGSMEETQRAVSDAVQAWAIDSFDMDDHEVWAHTEGTFSDRVVFTVSRYGEEPMRTTFQASYDTSDDGVELGEPQEVELSAVVTPKSTAVDTKTLEALRDIHAQLGQMLAQTDEEAPETDEPDSEAEADANSPDGDEGDGNAEGGDGISDLPAPSDLLVDLTADALLADVALDE